MYRLNLQAVALAILSLSFATVSRADEVRAKEILDRAIRAAGGEGTFRSQQAPMMWMSKGTYHGGDEPMEFIAQYSSKWPDWHRQEIEGIYATTVNGEAAWMTSENGVTKLKGERLAEQLKLTRANWAERLFPLLGEDYTLKAIDGKAVNGNETVGIEAKHKEGGEFQLYFDKDSYLLTKMEMNIVAPAHGPEPVLSEKFYSGHRSFGGVRGSSKLKWYIDGKLVVESETVDYKVFATLDPALFEPPE